MNDQILEATIDSITVCPRPVVSNYLLFTHFVSVSFMVRNQFQSSFGVCFESGLNIISEFFSHFHPSQSQCMLSL